MRNNNLISSFRRLDVGDIFLTIYPGRGGNVGNGIFLVIGGAGEKIEARMVTTQWIVTFDRSSLASTPHEGATFEVKSTQPLPSWAYSSLIGLDRRYSQGDDAKLTSEEMRALVFVSKLLDHE